MGVKLIAMSVIFILFDIQSVSLLFMALEMQLARSRCIRLER